MDYELEPLDEVEGQKLTDELQEVLAKYDAEIGVSSSIQLLKRVPRPIPSPDEFLPDNGEETTETKA